MNKPPEKKPAAVYARFSTDRQDARSIEDQTRRCRRFAEDRGYRVVAEFNDAAQSGASLERAGLQALLAEARSGKRCRFRAVLVDDLSRLSRDLGDTWSLIFNDLAGEGVVVIDVTSGLGSDTPAARVTFGALALVNDMARESVRTQTRRGLEGRALAGFHTGGRCYGYRTRPEENPPDPMHPRAVMEVEPDEAAIVLRIFKEYATGGGLRDIARGLNRDAIPAPYDKKAYTKPAGHGWGHATVRAVLHNRRYRGEVTWNKLRWDRGGARRRRRPRENDPSTWVRTDRPELVIVPADLWDRVQRRLAERRAESRKVPRSRPGFDPSVLSHLLVCGACRSRMTIAGGSKAGSRRFKCAANHSKGDEICANTQSISEAKLIAAITETFRRALTDPKYVKRLLATAERLWPQLVGGAATAKAPDLAAEVRRQEGRVADVGRALIGSPSSEFLHAALRQEETKLAALRAQLADQPATEPAPAAPRAPTAAELLALWADLEGTLRATPQEAQQALQARLAPVVLAPQSDGTVLLRTALKTSPAALVQDGRRVGSTGGCGGRI